MDSGFALADPDIATMRDGRQIVVADRFNSEAITILSSMSWVPTERNLTPRMVSTLSLTPASPTKDPQVAGGPDQALVVYVDNAGEASSSDFHITARLFNGATNTFATRSRSSPMSAPVTPSSIPTSPTSAAAAM